MADVWDPSASSTGEWGPDPSLGPSPLTDVAQRGGVQQLGEEPTGTPSHTVSPGHP